MPITRRDFCRCAAAALPLVGAFNPFNPSSLKAAADSREPTGLAAAYRDAFHIGTAVSNRTLQRDDAGMLALIAKEFDAITPENCLKWGEVHPEPGRWEWELPDRLVRFGAERGMYVVGHTLVWHSQMGRGVFADAAGKPASKEAVLKAMEEHIRAVVGRYKGRIAAWDVVNEAVDEDKGWRKSPWHEIVGPEFMERAFHWAHETDPKAVLQYNDYNMHNPAKAKFVCDFVRDFKKRGVPVHSVGMQGHVMLDTPTVAELESSITAFAAAGVRVSITELDVDVLPSGGAFNTAEVSARQSYAEDLNPWKDGLPKEMESRLARRYDDLFKLFLKHRDKIDRVTTWGTSDDESWKNDFPIPGRTNYPLLFDRDHKPKQAYREVYQSKVAPVKPEG